MRPVLEQLAPLERALELGDVVRPQPAEQDHPLGPGDRGDRIDLHRAERAYDLGHRLRRPAVEELSRDGEPPRLCERELDHRRTVLQPDHPPQPVERPVERRVERCRGPHAVLAVEGLDDELAARAFRLQVGAADDPVAPEERQHVVPVPALRRRLVDLDEVVEAEDAACEGPIPEQVLEGREEKCATRGRSVALRSGGDEDRRSAVVHVEPLEQAVCDERVDGRPDSRSSSPESPVLDDPALRESAARFDGTHRQRPQPLGLRGRGRGEDRTRENPLGKVVEPLESLTARDDELAVVPEQLEHLLRRLPAPHLPLPRGAVEVT